MIIRTNSIKAIDAVKLILESARISYVRKNDIEIYVTGATTETKIRRLLQSKLDDAGFDLSNNPVRVNGNLIWSYRRIMGCMVTIRESNSTRRGINEYFYSFMMSNFTEAHHNMQGWCARYPTWGSIKRILDNAKCPIWKSDVKAILSNIK